MEEKEERGCAAWGIRTYFQNGITFKYYFQCRRADIFDFSCTLFEVWVRVETEPPLDGARRNAAILATGRLAGTSRLAVKQDAGATSLCQGNCSPRFVRRTASFGRRRVALKPFRLADLDRGSGIRVARNVADT